MEDQVKSEDAGTAEGAKNAGDAEEDGSRSGNAKEEGSSTVVVLSQGQVATAANAVADLDVDRRHVGSQSRAVYFFHDGRRALVNTGGQTPWYRVAVPDRLWAGKAVPLCFTDLHNFGRPLGAISEAGAFLDGIRAYIKARRGRDKKRKPHTRAYRICKKPQYCLGGQLFLPVTWINGDGTLARYGNLKRLADGVALVQPLFEYNAGGLVKVNLKDPADCSDFRYLIGGLSRDQLLTKDGDDLPRVPPTPDFMYEISRKRGNQRRQKIKEERRFLVAPERKPVTADRPAIIRIDVASAAAHDLADRRHELLPWMRSNDDGVGGGGGLAVGDVVRLVLEVEYASVGNRSWFENEYEWVREDGASLALRIKSGKALGTWLYIIRSLGLPVEDDGSGAVVERHVETEKMKPPQLADLAVRLQATVADWARFFGWRRPGLAADAPPDWEDRNDVGVPEPLSSYLRLWQKFRGGNQDISFGRRHTELSGLLTTSQRTQLLDAYYWAFLHPLDDKSAAFRSAMREVVYYYEHGGFVARLKRPYKYTGRAVARGSLRSALYKPRRFRSVSTQAIMNAAPKTSYHLQREFAQWVEDSRVRDHLRVIHGLAGIEAAQIPTIFVATPEGRAFWDDQAKRAATIKRYVDRNRIETRIKFMEKVLHVHRNAAGASSNGISISLCGGGVHQEPAGWVANPAMMMSLEDIVFDPSDTGQGSADPGDAFVFSDPGSLLNVEELLASLGTTTATTTTNNGSEVPEVPDVDSLL